MVRRRRVVLCVPGAVLGVLRDGVLGVPGARGKGAEPALGALENGERRRGSVRCSDGVLAVPGGCAKGAEPAWAVLGPAPRFRLAQRGLARRWPYASPTAPPAKPL